MIARSKINNLGGLLMRAIAALLGSPAIVRVGSIAIFGYRTDSWRQEYYTITLMLLHC